MEKRNYTHIQALLPEIKAMLAEGKTQREIAEYFGLRDKQVVKELLNGVLYLSMIRDLYDNSIVAYKTATQQTVNLVLDTIRQAIRREKKKASQSCSSTATKAFNKHAI